MIVAIGVSLAYDTQSVMVREISEPAVSRPNRSSFLRAATGPWALALPLAAGGGKGALEPPPGGSSAPLRPQAESGRAKAKVPITARRNDERLGRDTAGSDISRTIT